MNHSRVIAIFTLLLVSACTQNPVGHVEFAEGQQQIAMLAAETSWRPCPGNLPPGCELAVLEGNPQAAGLFTARFRLPGGFAMPPHTHPKDERVTVISGKMAVAFGASATRRDAREFVPGDYYVNARGAIHHVWADETSVIQITGLGPWQADFVD